MKKRLFLTLMMALVASFSVQAQTKAFTQINIDTTVCGSFTWNVNGQTYTSSALVTYQSSDTLYVLDLTVHRVVTTPTEVTPISGVCYYDFCGQRLYTSGRYDGVMQRGGCDSAVAIQLTIAEYVDDLTTLTACESYTWRYGSRTDTIQCHESGLYTARITTHDSVLVNDVWQHCYTTQKLDLTLLVPTAYVVDTAIDGCDRVPYNFGNSNIYFIKPGTYNSDTLYGMAPSVNPYIQNSCIEYNPRIGIVGQTDIYNNMHPREGRQEQCFNKTTNVTVTIRHSTVRPMPVKGCDYYRFQDSYITVDSSKYDADSNRIYTYDTVNYDDLYVRSTTKAYYMGQNEVDCGDTIRLQLTINPNPVIWIEGESFLLAGNEGTTLYAKGDQTLKYTWYKGNTQVGTGDSLVVSAITANTDYTLVGINNTTTCSDTNMITVVLGIDQAEESAVRLYPNPATDRVSIDCGEAVESVEVFNLIGQRVMATNETTLSLDRLANGTYTVRVLTQSGKTMISNFVVKR